MQKYYITLLLIEVKPLRTIYRAKKQQAMININFLLQTVEVFKCDHKFKICWNVIRLFQLLQKYSSLTYMLMSTFSEKSAQKLMHVSPLQLVLCF